MKYNKIIAILALVLIFTSCKDDELTPVLTFEKATVGAYPRLVNLISNELDLANLSAAVYEYEVDFVDKEDGNLVEQYKIDVEFFDNNPDNGDSSQASKTFKTFGKSDFSTSSKGNPGMKIKITLDELLKFFDIKAEDIKPNDQFGFYTTVTDDQGRTYGSTNSSSTVRGSAFQGFFDNSVKATCPLPNDKFVGTYKVSYEPGGDAGYGYPIGTETVDLTLVSGSTTKRSFETAYIGSFGMTCQIDFVCDIVEFLPADAGAGCGGGSITIVQDPDKPNPADISDDSEIRLNIIDFDTDGGCGQPKTPKVLILTKQ